MKFEYILFVFYLIVAISGQLLQKIGMNHIGVINHTSILFNKSIIFKVVTNPFIIFGLLLSVIGFGLWLTVLSNFKMSNIYPMSSVAYIIMAFASFFFLGEQITWHQWLGTCVIVGGCFLLNIK